VRDVRSLSMALALPLFMILLFGYALSLDVDRIPTVLYDADRTPQSRDLVAQFGGSRYFQIEAVAEDYATVERKLDEGECLLGVVVPQDYSVRLLSRREPRVQLLLDGSDSNTASIEGRAISRPRRWRRAFGSGTTASSNHAITSFRASSPSC
jgi:ABC-2 type transport system permease protein